MSSMIGTTIVGVAALACAAGAIAGRPDGNVGHLASAAAGAPVVAADPAIVRLGGSASVTVRGLAGRRLEVRLAGATDAGWRAARMEAASPRGQGLAWKPADADASRHLPDRGAGRRRATSRAVGELDAPCLCSGDAFPPLLRHARRRSEMVGADRYGPCTVEGAQTLAPAGLRPARSRLHQLLVVAYSPVGHPGVDDRLGMFVTAVRNGFDGRWCLLEATLQP